ncbi:hypothetical protein WJX75_007685 [Coccomyxa subellipsoidea]|uniref:Uncharacterized protein n=1 Tax=Coccomyxa subellipsoidea TaxID=248742 RepID=A0ABR2YSB0_9CHLO
MAARTQVLEASMQEGSGKMSAHVVAPCPHDGVCPMEGTRSWCHFSQRFERSGLQRVTKIRSDGGLARTYQDERYSYVVIRKEPRPELSSPLSISRHRQDAAELESATPYVPKPQSWRKSESKMRQAAALQKILDGMQATEESNEEDSSNTLQTDRLGDRKQEGHRGLGGEGALVRQVVASSNKQTWLGPAGYRLARKARWGDLWPAHYAQSSDLGGKGR